LLPLARTDFAKAQLRLWIAEFEALAETAEREVWLSNEVVKPRSDWGRKNSAVGVFRRSRIHRRRWATP